MPFDKIGCEDFEVSFSINFQKILLHDCLAHLSKVFILLLAKHQLKWSKANNVKALVDMCSMGWVTMDNNIIVTAVFEKLAGQV